MSGGLQACITWKGCSRQTLADSAADAAAGRALGLEVARLADEGADPKLVHAKASMAKLFVSEAAYRCADRCVQVLGGVGTTSETMVERIFREVRGFRIYDGASEVHRWSLAQKIVKHGANH